jgi:hypothetical protein
MPKYNAFSDTVWNEKQVVKWWKLHQNDLAPRCGNLRTKVLTALIPLGILEREGM